MQVEAAVTTVRGEKISVGDVIARLKIKGLFRSTIYELIEQKIIQQALYHNNIIVPPEEIEKISHDMRTSLGIIDDSLFKKYLNFYGINSDQWHQNCISIANVDFLKKKIITTRKITESFRRDPLKFASVSIARIVCRSTDEVNLVLSAIAEDQKDFVELARIYSADDSTRLSGGYIGHVKRGILPPDVESQAFEGKDNQIIGPFHKNSLWIIYKIYSVNVPKLTDTLKTVIRDQIFSEWLREQVCTVPA